MKQLIKYIRLSIRRVSFFMLMIIGACACSDFLDTDSDAYLKTDDNKLTSPNDSVYSLFGILSEFQKLGDEIVVLGELKADLMDVSIHSDKYLREINSHSTLSPDNPYLDVSPYYAVINNCNYVIAHMDTVVGNNALLSDYAAAVKIRAYTYFLLAKTFSQVRYYENPVLSVEEARNMDQYPLISRESLLGILIPQLQKIVHVTDPLRSMNDIPMGLMIPSAEFLLAECYLWLNQYELAATYYKRMMEEEPSGHMLVGNTITYTTTGWNMSWNNIFGDNKGGAEVVACICYHPSLGVKFPVKTLCDEDMVKPSSKAIDHWYAQENNNLNASAEQKLLGDLRGFALGLTSWSLHKTKDVDHKELSIPYITKFKADTTFGGRVLIERASMYHLRYAEVVNRMGKPTLALAALNYGLKKSIVSDSKYVNPAEVGAEPPFVTDFLNARYDDNLGVRSRAGMKAVSFPTGDKTLATLQDSILFVEDAILNEAALEMAFEGSRWSDLVRVGLRRLNNGEQNDFVAKTVSEKFIVNEDTRMPFTPSADPTTIYNKLLDSNNFFIPFPEK